MVPDPHRAGFRLYKTVAKVIGEEDIVHPMTSQCQGQQVTPQVHVGCDLVQDFIRHASDVVMRDGRADERLHDGQEVHCEFVFVWSHLVLMCPGVVGKKRE